VPLYTITEKQTVLITYQWQVRADSEEEALEKANEGVPYAAAKYEKTLNTETEAKCSHENQYVSDRSQFVCSDCNEELGR
jgi:hypothetical protein